MFMTSQNIITYLKIIWKNTLNILNVFVKVKEEPCKLWPEFKFTSPNNKKNAYHYGFMSMIFLALTTKLNLDLDTLMSI